MTKSRVDPGVDVAALLGWPVTAGFPSFTPQTCRSSTGGSP